MSLFPRTTVGGLSVSRMIIGTNWFLGWSHTTGAKDRYIRENVKNPEKIAEIMEVFVNSGVDTVMGNIQVPELHQAIDIVQQRTGKEIIMISTPGLPATIETAAKGFDVGEVEQVLDLEAKLGAKICMPHTSTTDIMVDKCAREVRHMEPVLKMIRDRGMIPGFSTHVPETIIYADEHDMDVQSYVSIFNAMGFLMQLEVDWTQQIIHNAKKPVMTIKPMAAGHIRPLQAFTFVWNAIRDQDMVTVGTMSPYEAAECVELSMGILERRKPEIKLQETRSKSTVK